MSLSSTLSFFRDRLQQLEATSFQAFDSISTIDRSPRASTSNANRPIPTSGQTQPPPTSLRPKLPTEVLDIVFSSLSKEQLKPLLYTNSFISALATQRLYHEVELSRPALVIAFLRTVLASERLPLLVRSLDITATKSETVMVGVPILSFNPNEEDESNLEDTPSFTPHPLSDATRTTIRRKKALPTSNFYALLARGLRRMCGLVSLSLELPKAHAPLWIFDGCTFQLRQFTTSMFCRRPLAHFLETQPTIVELTLRGYQTESLMLFPFVDPAQANTHASALGIDGPFSLGEDSVFELALEALPNLRAFNAVHADADLVRAVVEGRPVRTVSLPLFPERSIASLDALYMSSARLRRLSVISFDPTAPDFLFEALARRFVDLEALHLVMLMAEYDQALLERSAIVLSNFKCLKYITFMAAPSRPNLPANPPPLVVPGNNVTPAGTISTSQPDSADADADQNDEAGIAAKWHRACPTLRTIILPKGRVWFQNTSLSSAGSSTVNGAARGGSGGGGGGVGDENGSGSGLDGIRDGMQTPAPSQPQVVWSAL